MKIITTIKPQKIVKTSLGFDFQKIVASTKDEVISLATANHQLTFFNLGAGYIVPGSNPQYLRVFNLEKHRKVVEVLPTKAKAKNPPNTKNGKKELTRVVKTPGHWVAYVYDVPIEVLKINKLRVTIGNRNFKIIKNTK
jgi:hypothetical protein